jgi:hypothetical protein
MTDKQVVQTGTKETAVERVVDITQYVIDVKLQGLTHKLDPIGIAREAEQAESLRDQGRAQSVRVGDHLLLLAARCADASEFDAVIKETMRRLNWGRGREQGAPRTFSVYVAAIKRGMSKFGLRPMDTIEIPMVREGAIVRNGNNVPAMERVKLDGIGVFKRAMNNFKIAEREAAHVKDDRRSEPRKEAERMRATGFLTEEAERAVSKVLWAVRHTRDEMVAANITEELLAVAERYKPLEPFPEDRIAAPH